MFYHGFTIILSIYIYISMMSIYQLSFICVKCFTILIDFCFEVIQQLRIRKMHWFPPELGSAESKLISQLGDVLGRIREAVKSPWGDCHGWESPFVAKTIKLGHWVISMGISGS